MHNIKDVLNDVIGQLALRRPDASKRIEHAWNKYTDEKEKKHTSLVSLSAGKLIVHVDSPAWLYQMNTKKKTLLERLQKEIATVKDISFRVGKIK